MKTGRIGTKCPQALFHIYSVNIYQSTKIENTELHRLFTLMW